MERILRVLFLLIFFLNIFLYQAYADEINSTNLITPQNVDFRICTRTYAISEEKMFYLAIAAAKANNFEVNEIQSKTGYILFTANGKQYLSSILKVDNTHTQIKITPVNNNYFFPPGIIVNFFRYIDLNGATPLVEIPKV